MTQTQRGMEAPFSGVPGVVDERLAYPERLGRLSVPIRRPLANPGSGSALGCSRQ
jgi:hypothetical protein